MKVTDEQLGITQGCVDGGGTAGRHAWLAGSILKSAGSSEC